jgi:hypothetical protein
LSQRTRARTTGDATRKAPEAAPTPKGRGEQTVPTPGPSPTGSGEPEQAPVSSHTLTGGGEIAPEALARTLRAVAAELERDPALARRIAEALAAPAPPRRERSTRVAPRLPLPEDGSSLPAGEGSEVGAARVNRSFRPRLITGARPELGAGIPDPFALYAEKGEQGLRAVLAELRTGSLRAIVREHRLDPAGRLAGNNDADKLRAAIVKAVLRAAR